MSRYGAGVTKEVGQDMVNLRAKKVGVFTDSNLVNLPPMKTVLESLVKNNVNFVVYDKVRVEPTDESFKAAAEFSIKEGLDTFLAVGGGSSGGEPHGDDPSRSRLPRRRRSSPFGVGRSG